MNAIPNETNESEGPAPVDYSQDKRVIAIRKDAYINDLVKGTWTVQECYSDKDIATELDADGITTVREAIKSFRFMERVLRDRKADMEGMSW
jgi:hypothetical protein